MRRRPLRPFGLARIEKADFTITVLAEDKEGRLGKATGDQQQPRPMGGFFLGAEQPSWEWKDGSNDKTGHPVKSTFPPFYGGLA